MASLGSSGSGISVIGMLAGAAVPCEFEDEGLPPKTAYSQGTKVCAGYWQEPSVSVYMPVYRDVLRVLMEWQLTS